MKHQSRGWSCPAAPTAAWSTAGPLQRAVLLVMQVPAAGYPALKSFRLVLV